MTNRLKTIYEEPEKDPPADDYYEVSARCETYYVTRATAAVLLQVLDRRWPPRWLRFRDLWDAEVRVRTCLVESITECTSDHRAAEREFHRARRREDRADRRPWEDEDW